MSTWAEFGRDVRDVHHSHSGFQDYLFEIYHRKRIYTTTTFRLSTKYRMSQFRIILNQPPVLIQHRNRSLESSSSNR